MAEIPKYNTAARDTLKAKITTGPDAGKEIHEFVTEQLKDLEIEIVEGIPKEKANQLLQQQIDQAEGPLGKNSAITVVATQAALVHLGYKPDMHGFLSAKTRKEITKFQKEWNKSHADDQIKEDGIPGPNTVTRLIQKLNQTEPQAPAANVDEAAPDTIDYTPLTSILENPKFKGEFTATEVNQTNVKIPGLIISRAGETRLLVYYRPDKKEFFAFAKEGKNRDASEPGKYGVKYQRDDGEILGTYVDQAQIESVLSAIIEAHPKTDTDKTTTPVEVEKDDKTKPTEVLKPEPAAPTEAAETTPRKQMSLDDIFAQIEEKILNQSEKALKWGDGNFVTREDGLYVRFNGTNNKFIKIIEKGQLTDDELEKIAELARTHSRHFELKVNMHAIGKRNELPNLSQLADMFKDHPDYKIDAVESMTSGVRIDFYEDTFGWDDIAFSIHANNDGSYTLLKDDQQENYTSMEKLKTAAFKEKSPLIKIDPELREKAEKTNARILQREGYEIVHVYTNKIHYTRNGISAFKVEFNPDGTLNYKPTNEDKQPAYNLDSDEFMGYVERDETGQKPKSAPKPEPAAPKEQKEEAPTLKDKDDTSFAQIRDKFLEAAKGSDVDWYTYWAQNPNTELFYLEEGRLMVDLLTVRQKVATNFPSDLDFNPYNDGMILDLNNYTKEAQEEILYKVKHLTPALKLAKAMQEQGETPQGYPDPKSVLEAFYKTGLHKIELRGGINYEDNRTDPKSGKTGLKRTEFAFNNNGEYKGRVQIYSNGTIVIFDTKNSSPKAYETDIASAQKVLEEIAHT